MANIINQKDCLTTRKNLGFSDCVIEFGIVDGFILTPKGWSLDLTSLTFNKEYVNDQIQLGNFIPFLGAVEFLDNTPESTTEEYQGGIKKVVRKGLPEFAFKYIRGGWKFANALATWDSFQQYDMLLVSRGGNIAGVNSQGNILSAFDLGMMDSGSFKHFDGAVSASVTVMLQLLNETQYNQEVAILDRSVLDFNPTSEIFPVTDIVLKDVVADASDNKIAVKAVFAMNQSSILGGATSANFRVYVNGTSSAIDTVVYNQLTSKYEISMVDPFASGNPIVVELYDTTNSVATAKIGVRYYKGVSTSVNAVA
jgi:hypothetical protein